MAATDGFGVLFLCTGNSARSILAEALLRRRGGERFRSYSAGSDPKAAPHPVTLEVLSVLGHETGTLRSKSWDEFAGPEAPRIDCVVTVCANAAGETCPVWPGAPVSVHWGVDDPAAFEGSAEARRACFVRVHDELAAKIDGLVALDPAALEPEARQAAIQALADRGAS